MSLVSLKRKTVTPAALQMAYCWYLFKKNYVSF